MFCPQCGAEYREGVSECWDCQVALVPEALQPPAGGDFVEVFRTADASLLPVVKSVLDGAAVPHLVQGDEAHGLYPFGSVGGGGDRRLLGAAVLVPAAEADAARALLAELPAEVDGSDGEE